MTDVVSDPDRHPIDLLAEEFAARCRRGERPSPSDYARQYPQYEQELRELLPPIAMMENLKRRNLSGSSDAPVILPFQKLGDFEIVREIGRGGMGVVYEARQQSLGRQVALKVLSRASLLDPQRVKRFEQEARAAANLHHTNIVPVFGVGQDEGVHYYAMQFIEGRPLSDLIASMSQQPHPCTSTSGRGSGPNAIVAAPNAGDASSSNPTFAPPHGRRYWRWVADVGRQAADALAYAHHQGVLHRDVKPANLLLDGRGAVWVTDFGLAKLDEVQNVTQSGDIVGTLQYLPPEALRSQSDARSDVYALGLTLYEMLTLRPAFEESNPAALMRRVSEGLLPRPSKFNPHIPRDLENIVLKAIGREPDSRYPSAAALAEDLDNFIHDRPIAARRAYVTERLWRWCRRNRLVASLGAIALSCAAAAIVVGWVAYGVTRRALAAEATRRHQAEVAQHRADANVALSLKSFEQIFNQLAPPNAIPPLYPGRTGAGPRGGGGGGAAGGSSSSEAALLNNILEFYDHFAKQNVTNPALEAEAATAYRRVGDTFLRFGRPNDGDAAYRRSASIFSDLLLANPNSERDQRGFVQATIRLGIQQRTMKPDDVQLIHRAVGFAGHFVTRNPGNIDDAQMLADVLLREGSAQWKAGKLAEAEAAFRRSMAVAHSASALNEAARKTQAPPPPPRLLHGFAAPLALGELLVDAHRFEEARPVLREALEELNHERNGPPRVDVNIGQVYDRLADLAEAAGARELADRARNDGGMERFPPERGFPPEDGQRPPPPTFER